MGSDFETLEDACEGLLLTTASIFNRSGIPYAIAGGWVPMLLGRHTSISHPGTRDVDVLLVDKEIDPAPVATMLLDEGFEPSAKHEFQLLRTARVCGQSFVFNVDLLHPHEARNHPDMFSDVLDLDIPDKLDRRGRRFIKSVAFNNASLISELGLSDELWRQGRDLSGDQVHVPISILTPAAAILSKCESCTVKKRYRDAFDIYFLLTGANGTSLATEVLELASQAAGFNKELGFLREFIDNEPDRFDANVRRYVDVADSPAQAIASVLNWPPSDQQ